MASNSNDGKEEFSTRLEPVPPPTQQYSPLIDHGQDLSAQQKSPSGIIEMTNDEMEWLLKTMTMEDQNVVKEIARQCVWEKTTTRGLPVTAALLGGVYFTGLRFPQIVAPKSMPFYFVAGMALLPLTTFVFSLGGCVKRIEPTLIEFYDKYRLLSGEQSFGKHNEHAHMTYDQLREANRQGLPKPSQNFGGPPVSQQQQPIGLEGLRQGQGRTNRYSNVSEEPPLLSGTPSETHQTDPYDYLGLSSKIRNIPEDEDIGENDKGSRF